MSDARSYLAAQDVEKKLTDAVASVLKSRPADAIGEICKTLAANTLKLEDWIITCPSGCDVKLTVSGKTLLQVANCYCSDCRKANGGKLIEELALCTVKGLETMPFPQEGDPKMDLFKIVPGDEYEDKVPRWFCKECDTWLLGDVRPAGFGMMIAPIRNMASTTGVPMKAPQFYMHTGKMPEGSEPTPEDGLPRFASHPEDPFMAELVANCM